MSRGNQAVVSIDNVSINTDPNTLLLQDTEPNDSRESCNRFEVHFLSEKKKLEKNYNNVDDLRKDAFSLCANGILNDNNALLMIPETDRNELVVLLKLPKSTLKGDYQNLFIKFVRIDTIEHKFKFHFDFCFLV